MSIEYKSVSELSQRLGALPKEVRKALRPGLVAAGDIVAAQVRTNASWSGRIPGAVYTQAKLGATGGALVGVNAAAAPEARVLELGNEGSRSEDFRHPVWANPWWVEQPRMPFFFQAIDQTRERALAAVDAAVTEAMAIGGLV